MNGVRAVFFDAGNTLLAASPPVEAAYGNAFARYGVEVPREAVLAAIRGTWSEVAARQAAGTERWGARDGERGFWRSFVQGVFTRVGGGGLPEELLDDLVAHFQDQRHWAVYPEVVEVLETLRASGFLLFVLSNWDSTLPGLLERLGLKGHFDGIVVSALVGASKPAPEIFAVALARAGVNPEEALHVGDSPSEDYEGALRAGLSALLLDRHGVSPGSFDSIRSLSEVVHRLGGRQARRAGR